MHVLMLPFAPRFILYTTAVAGTVSLALLALWQPALLPFLSVPIAVFAGLAVLGTVDLAQTRHAVLRNDPISAHLRPRARQTCCRGPQDPMCRRAGAPR